MIPEMKKTIMYDDIMAVNRRVMNNAFYIMSTIMFVNNLTALLTNFWVEKESILL